MADQNKLPLELKSQTFIPTVNVAAATWPARPPLPPFTRRDCYSEDSSGGRWLEFS